MLIASNYISVINSDNNMNENSQNNNPSFKLNKTAPISRFRRNRENSLNSRERERDGERERERERERESEREIVFMCV